MKKETLGIVVFVMCLCFLTFVYGVATVQFDLWPNSFFTKAKNAFDAALVVADEENKRRKFRTLRFLEKEGYEGQTFISHSESKDVSEGYIFMEGGDKELISHCPEQGCLAWVMDRQGNILHTWDLGDRQMWDDLQKVSGYNLAERNYEIGAKLFDNGDIVVTYQGNNAFPYGIGMARFDKDSNLLWKKENFAHHWFTVDKDGYIYTPGFRKLEIPYQLGDSQMQVTCDKGGMYEDTILILDPADGSMVEEISIYDVFINSGYSGVLYEYKNPDQPLPMVSLNCDPTHLNDVRLITAEQAATSTIVAEGDLLISLRNTNTVAVIDGRSRLVKWLSIGRSVQQHSPRYIGNDRVLVFDNLGGRLSQGGTRILQIDMHTDETRVIYPPESTPEGFEFLQQITGYISVNNDNTRALASLTHDGKAVELDLVTGELLWEYINTHDVTDIVEVEEEGPVYGRFPIHTIDYIEELPTFELNGEVTN